MATGETVSPSNFIRNIIDEHNQSGRFGGKVVTRFPPEPNGYLHIGHAKSICLNFGLAADYGGRCHLRFDDTNPAKEEQEYLDSIIEDVHWLGFDWGSHLYYASNYFEQLYQFALKLIADGKAYVGRSERRGDKGQPGHADPAGGGQPLPEPWHRGEPGAVPGHEGRRVPRRRAGAPGQDRHGPPQPGDARPHPVPHPPGDPPPHREHLVHLPHVRLHPLHLRLPSRASPTPSAPWSSRTTESSTTGSWTSWASTTPSRSSSPA